MALGKRCRTCLKSKRSDSVAADEGLDLGLVRYTRSFGRKRIVISNIGEASPLDSSTMSPLKKLCGDRMVVDSERSRLEALPQDVLIRILCGVDHEDLKQLFHVSKPIREATVIAKQWHFAYSTPSKTRAFRTAIDLQDCCEVDEIDTPNAPKQHRQHRSRLSGKKLQSISVALFASPDEEHWPRKELFTETGNFWFATLAFDKAICLSGTKYSLILSQSCVVTSNGCIAYGCHLAVYVFMLVGGITGSQLDPTCVDVWRKKINEQAIQHGMPRAVSFDNRKELNRVEAERYLDAMKRALEPASNLNSKNASSPYEGILYMDVILIEFTLSQSQVETGVALIHLFLLVTLTCTYQMPGEIRYGIDNNLVFSRLMVSAIQV
ncbi:hypothetical protein FNV43_RR07661 [Rhamnella rubrinervis]|uniref:F-box domain-containing protein n=1 Tax=Rhamnella rubrinervis TaxID=2594499 RepID=A0A8K0MMD7_9ROSA|nr:hypothetical protein FNV43_RR07661 [Rhamnella rubrinervis]